MNGVKKIGKMLTGLSVMVLFFSLLLTPIGTVQAEEDDRVLQLTIDATSEYLKQQGIGNEWQAIGLVKAGKEVPKTYFDHFQANLQQQVISKSGHGRMKITDVERMAIAAVAVGIDPFNADGKGFNLIEKIYHSEPWVTGDDSLTYQGNNGIIFALIALDSNQFTVPKGAKWTRENLITELISYQKRDGSWSLSTSTTGATSFDITAMAITALAPYREQSAVKSAIDKAVNFLSDAQGPTGGFDEPFVGGISSESTSQVIIGLTANQIDPRSEKFTKGGNNLIEHLLSFKTMDGGFKHTVDDASANGMATEQALQALVAFDLYTKGKGALYHFTEQVVKPVPQPNGFTDIQNHWAKDSIQQAIQLGIVQGYSDGSFQPNNPLTRAQAVSIIVRALDMETNVSAPFKDISGYAKETQAEIAAAYHYGIVTGNSGNFMPSQKVTRAQMALMLYRASESTTGEKYSILEKTYFTDLGNYSEETVRAISMLYEVGIATGTNGKYMPSDPTTRAHATKMLVNYLSQFERLK